MGNVIPSFDDDAKDLLSVRTKKGGKRNISAHFCAGNAGVLMFMGFFLCF